MERLGSDKGWKQMNEPKKDERMKEKRKKERKEGRDEKVK